MLACIGCKYCKKTISGLPMKCQFKSRKGRALYKWIKDDKWTPKWCPRKNQLL